MALLEREAIQVYFLYEHFARVAKLADVALYIFAPVIALPHFDANGSVGIRFPGSHALAAPFYFPPREQLDRPETLATHRLDGSAIYILAQTGV